MTLYYIHLNKIKEYRVYKVKETNEFIVNITFNDKENKFNMITATLSPEGKLIQLQEISSSLNVKTNKATVKSYINGTLTVNESFIAEDENDSGINTFSFFGSFNKCMKDKGVPGWIITSIGVGCTVACAITAGAGCLACAVGLGGTWSGQIGYCLGYASRN